MQQRNRKIPTRAAIAALSLAAAVIGAAGWPAMAAPEDYKGFFLALDLANTQPNGLDQQYATYVDGTNGFATRMVMENDADLTFEVKVGYSWGALGGLAVSYWSFDNEDEVQDTVTGSSVYPTVFGNFGYNYINSYGLFNYPVNVNASSQVQASTIDIDYFRPMQAGEKLTINWIAGLRSATFEEDRAFTGTDTSIYYYNEAKHIESDAFGVKVGAMANFGFTEHFGLQGMMAFSFLQANIDAEATRLAAGGNFDQVTSSDDNVQGEIRDYDLRAVWSWDHFDFWIGYGGQTWEGLVEDPVNGAHAFVPTADESERDSIAFNKLHAGIAFRFGGH
jgi:hypothetical protein